MSISAKHHGDDAPSGKDLEYEKVFTDLMLAAQPEEERQAGNEIIAAQEPEPKSIVKCATAVLDQSNDLRAAILYGYARLRIDGLPGLAGATAFLRICLEEYWDTCHPQLDADDDNDPTMRVNSVLALVDRSTILRALRNAPLTASPAFGGYSLRDMAIADGEVSAPADMASPPNEQSVSAAFQDTPRQALDETAAAARAILADVHAINSVFDDRLPGQGPNLGDFVATLKKINAVLAPHITVLSSEADEAPQTPAAGATPGAASVRAAPPGAISSQADVRDALDKMIAYYAKYEPSSPLPLLLERARRLVGADFMTIMGDIAPLGLDSVRLIGGKENPK